MEITWMGTAGFKIRTMDQVFLVDPYLSRNLKAVPVQPLKPPDIEKPDAVFLSHGHFDHIRDVPEIAGRTGAKVFCSDTAGDTLNGFGLDRSLIEPVTQDSWSRDFGSFQAEACFSQHVRFDKKLLFSTLLKINVRFFKLYPLLKKFPCGQVLSWRFIAEGLTLHFFGSAGSSKKELQTLARSPVDILMVPLQGHSDICNIAFDYVRILSPKVVIPHHQDDFFPPISQFVDIRPFVRRVEKECPGTRIKVMKINETWDTGSGNLV